MILVSGLPRSGTSLMMQMLEASGVPILTDGVRAADEDNPQGYFELEAVKRTARDPAWLDAAVGKAVKVVHLLLADLPTAGRRYQVILMRRNLDEVLESQARMLERHGRAPARLSSAELQQVFARQLDGAIERMAADPAFEVLEVNFNELLADPRAGAQRVAEFVGRTGSVDAMAGVVDERLYRNRAPASVPLGV